MGQIEGTIELLHDLLMDSAIGAYPHGSWVLGGLQPHSDIDILVVSKRGTTAEEKRGLVDRLLRVSGSGNPEPHSRSIELTIVVQSQIKPWRYPPQLDFQYGEWMRGEFERGDLPRWPAPSPDLAVLLTIAMQGIRPLFGPALEQVLDPIPQHDVFRGMVEGIPGLLSDLEWDTRNLVLTFARIWTTMVTEVIRSKDFAARWALARLPAEHCPVLERAMAIYLGDLEDNWRDLQSLIRPHVDYVVREIEGLIPGRSENPTV